MSKKTDNATLTATYEAAQTIATEAVAAAQKAIEALVDARTDLAKGYVPEGGNGLMKATGTFEVNDGDYVTGLQAGIKGLAETVKPIAPKAERQSSGTRPVKFALVNKADGQPVFGKDSGVGWFANEGTVKLRGPKYATIDLSAVQIVEVETGRVIRDGSALTLADAPGTPKAAA